jgi:phosphatidate cytidylyltransferase
MQVNNLTIRILVALVGIPLLLFFAIQGGVVFFLFVALVSGLALYEFYALVKAKGVAPQVGLGLLFGFCMNAAFFHGKLQYALLSVTVPRGVELPLPSMTQLFLILYLLFVPLILLVELFRDKPQAMMNVAATVFGVTYVSLFLGALVGVRELFVPADFPVYAHFQVPGSSVPPEVEQTIYRWGGLTVIAIFASIWICDSAAYFVGKAFGRNKLFERVSPKKTWEGAIAGFLGAILAFVGAKALMLPYLSYGSALVCGGIVGVFGQLGDLAESLLKRDAGVKDSSALIPGHGGIFDRFDSLIFVSPLLFFYLDFLVF